MISQPAKSASSSERLAWSYYSEATGLVNQGREAEAAKRLDAALREKPDFAEALVLGAYILARGGKPEIALRFYQKALAHKRKSPTAWSNMGKLLFQLGRFEEALAAFDEVIKLKSDDSDSLNSRSGALRALGRLEESEAAARAALRLRPAFAEASLNLGTALLKLGRSEEALSAYQRALLVKADHPEALCGQALALRALGRLDEARKAFEAAERLGSREAISGKGCLDLTLGDFERGWEGYEARWIAGKSLADALGIRFPTWSGPGQTGDRVLVFNDHGLGDTLQFSRYLALMTQAGVTVTFVCPLKLHRLLSRQFAVRFVEKVPAGETFDAQIAVSSLPRAFSTRLETIPATIPYLIPEPERLAKWAARIGQPGFKIGVAWQGNPNPEADMARSFPIAHLAPLSESPRARLISLQTGFGVEQLRRSPGNLRIESLGDDFDAGPDAFLDAAAVIAHVDLVVTCDTSIAHLAGALGRPVWVALKHDAEWRWMRGREDSPWYPTMRLFRQREIGDWGSVFAAMSERLKSVS